MQQPLEPGFALALMDRIHNMQLNSGKSWIRPISVQKILFNDIEPIWTVKVVDQDNQYGYVPCKHWFDYVNSEEVVITYYA